jgi:hypothetical protein
VRHQVQGQQRQGDDERVDQQAHDLDRGLLAAAHDRQQAEDQHERQDRPRRRRMCSWCSMKLLTVLVSATL